VATYGLVALLREDLDVAERRLAAGLKLLPDDSMIGSLQGLLHARRRERHSAMERVRRALDCPHSFGHTHHTHYTLACIHAELGEPDKAMAWLERSVDTGFACWPFFRIDPYLENLRAEPAFTRLVDSLEQTYSALKIQKL
jgi:predicted Zn-dependent protease